MKCVRQEIVKEIAKTATPKVNFTVKDVSINYMFFYQWFIFLDLEIFYCSNFDINWSFSFGELLHLKMRYLSLNIDTKSLLKLDPFCILVTLGLTTHRLVRKTQL